MPPDDEQLSQHPVDRLIRALIHGEQVASVADVELIVARLATADFDERHNSLPRHLKQRREDGQWSVGTTQDEFLQDLRHAVKVADGLAVFERRGGHMALTSVDTRLVVPSLRLGAKVSSRLFVFYSADRGKLVSGYQDQGIEKLALPEDVRWLK